METKVRDVMTDRSLGVSPNATVVEAAQLMTREEVDALPVLDGEELAGIVTERDIVRRAIAEKKDPREMRVREVWSRDVVRVRAGDDLAAILEHMAGRLVLPVVDERNRLLGVLTQRDVAQAAKEEEALRRRNHC